jgi:hypothetical protein
MPFFFRLPVSNQSGTDYQSAANFRQIVRALQSALYPSNSVAGNEGGSGASRDAIDRAANSWDVSCALP